MSASEQLARMERRIAVARFLKRFPDFALTGTPQRTGRVRFRGFASLPATMNGLEFLR